MRRFCLFFLSIAIMMNEGVAVGMKSSIHPDSIPGVKIIRNVIIYKDARFHAAFPSVIKRKNGQLILAFRKAPDRRVFSEKSTGHIDPNSYLVKVTSKDGINWSNEPELIYAHDFGGSQDPCLLQLHDGTILCTSYGWAVIQSDGLLNMRKPYFDAGNGRVFLGGYYLISHNGAKTWEGPFYPPHITPEINFSATGESLHAYNRGALFEGKSGKIYWVVAASDDSSNKTSNHLLISEDKGKTWKYSSTVAIDDKASFNEASVYETPKGDLVAFLRTANMDDQACIARSTDGGKTFHPWQKMGFQGHPLQALQLPDNRVLLCYGYRHKPYGIRARILNPECTDFDTAPEIILRSDGSTTDIGYPWAVMLNKKMVLVTYYFSVLDGPQHIAGTVIELEQGD